MLTVACVLRSGGQYTRDHVRRLAGHVRQNMQQPYRFACLTDTSEFSDDIPLVSKLPGYWSKLELFRPGVLDCRGADWALYLDLDVTVTGNLDDLANFCAVQATSFAIMRDPNIPLSFNSSVMCWRIGEADALWQDFEIEKMARLRRGDQQWVTEQKPEAACFPRDWCVSYKRATKNNEWPDDMRVCVYHGRPKPWEAHQPIPDRFTHAA